MKISYLITVHNETDTFRKLIDQLLKYRSGNDEIVIIDDFSDDPITKKELSAITWELSNKKIVQHKLTDSYGDHKNFGIEQCDGDFIFQIDADELPSENILGDNLKTIIESNPDIECFLIPRMNDFKGVNQQHVAQWGWRLSTSPSLQRPLVNWPDFQYRIYKRDYPRISYKRRLHEKVEGFNSYSFLPADENYAMIHDKTIEKQVQTNLMYNKKFTQEENSGYTVK